MNRPHYSTFHFLVSLLLLTVLFEHFLENSPPRFTWTWQDCSRGLHRTNHHPQYAVANSRKILMKMGSASNKCHCCGWYRDRRQATWHSVWLCPSLFASNLREQTILHYYNVRFKWQWRVLLMDSSIFCCPAPLIWFQVSSRISQKIYFLQPYFWVIDCSHSQAVRFWTLILR